jgi:hypothetical protein
MRQISHMRTPLPLVNEAIAERRCRTNPSEIDDRLVWPAARACNIFAGCSIEDYRVSHETGHLCQKSGVSDRQGGSLWAGQSFNIGTELLCERFDDARAEPGFWLSKDAVQLANTVVSDRKLPVCSGNIIRNGDLPKSPRWLNDCAASRSVTRGLPFGIGIGSENDSGTRGNPCDANPLRDNTSLRSGSDMDNGQYPPHEPSGNSPPGTGEEADAKPYAE